MSSETRTRTVAEARSVGSAAAALARALSGDASDVAEAKKQLELQGTLAIDEAVSGFDAGQDEPSEDDLLAASLSSLSIGLTLVAAEVASSDNDPEHLVRAALYLTWLTN